MPVTGGILGKSFLKVISGARLDYVKKAEE
jgi:hypothetical protein